MHAEDYAILSKERRSEEIVEYRDGWEGGPWWWLMTDISRAVSVSGPYHGPAYG